MVYKSQREPIVIECAANQRYVKIVNRKLTVDKGGNWRKQY